MTTDFEKEVAEFLQGFAAKKTEETAELQRSDEWREARRGKLTASNFAKLMKCKAKESAKNPKSWGSKFWLMNFGETAITYMKDQAFERATGICIESPDLFAFRWGRMYEPEAKAALAEAIGKEIKEVGFIEFQENSGASPDGELETGEAVELKCPSTVHSHMDLRTAPMDETHDYFWQTTGEMLALQTKSLLFATYHPHFPEASKLKHQWVRLSEPHAFALKFRCLVANWAIDRFIESNFDLDLRVILDEIERQVPESYNEIIEWYEANKN